MSLHGIQLESIIESDLQDLVHNKVLENKTLEYKEDLPGNSDKDKKEFLADISAFANAAGGDLIYGIKEVDGEPIEVCGLQIPNVDAEKLRLENIIRDGVEPRISGLSIRAIPVQTSKVAIIIRIPRSWALPHMVNFKMRPQFYSRNSAGKYPLDISEIRAAFALSETVTERIRNFRVERLSKIVSGETPVSLYDDPKIVLHITSIGAFDPAVKFDMSSLPRDHRLDPIYLRGNKERYNFDGFLVYRQNDDSECAYSYVQVFRNGSIEAVDAYMIHERGDKHYISPEYEEKLLQALPRYLGVQKQLGVELPLFLMVSLLGVSGYTMYVDSMVFFHDIYEYHPIDRDALLVPEMLVENYESDPTEVMKPIFDAIWNAAGWPRSMNYDNEGNWVGVRR